MKTKKQFPKIQSDSRAEKFISEADLSTYDFSKFKKTTFEFQPKSHSINVRLSEGLYNAVKKRSASKGLKTQQFIRKALENAI